MVFILSFLVVSLDNMDMETTASAVAATLNNIGPGFKAVGPSQNFEQFSALSKLVLSFDMLAGRLELFPLLLLFHPSAWKKF
jgi:trk system potassium uptake protein TrkH